jgi:hypothetical protein
LRDASEHGDENKPKTNNGGGGGGGGSPISNEAVDSFLEELVVRRELADNYCLHNPDYDAVEVGQAHHLDTKHVTSIPSN